MTSFAPLAFAILPPLFAFCLFFALARILPLQAYRVVAGLLAIGVPGAWLVLGLASNLAGVIAALALVLCFLLLALAWIAARVARQGAGS